MDVDVDVDVDVGQNKSVSEVSEVSEKNRGLFCILPVDKALGVDVGAGVDAGVDVGVGACVDVGMDTHLLDNPL